MNRNGNGDSGKPDGSGQWLEARLEAASRLASSRAEASLHPAWGAFIAFCRELRHGEIDRLKIQGGLPVLAELTRKKVKFAP